MSTGTTPPTAPPAAGRRQTNDRNHQNNRPLSQFVPKIPGIETLGTSTEQRRHDFAKFLKSIHHHALTTFHHSKDISSAILEFKDPLAVLRLNMLSLSQIRTQNNLNPSSPVADESDSEAYIREAENPDRRDEVKLLYGIQLKSNAEREKDLSKNLTMLWATIMGQCTPALQEEVHGEPDYMSKSSSFDSVWLLQSLQKITAGVNKTTNKYHSAFKATKKFYSTHQNANEGIDKFYNRFENTKDLVCLFKANVVNISSLLIDEQLIDSAATEETTMQKYLAVALIMNANKVKYESLWNKLENDLLVGTDSYPKTLGDATHLLTNWKVITAPNNCQNPGNNQDKRPGAPNVNFVGTPTEWAALVPLPANKYFSALTGFDSTPPTLAPSRKPPHNISAAIECAKCKENGHYATPCPFDVPNTAPQLFQFVHPPVQLNQTQLQSILIPGSIIVDSGSSFNCFRERYLISNIQPCEPFNTFSNGGGMTYTHKGTLTAFNEQP